MGGKKQSTEPGAKMGETKKDHKRSKKRARKMAKKDPYGAGADQVREKRGMA